MTIKVDDIKTYLRVDTSDDDALIADMISAAKKHCMDVLRTDDEDELDKCENGKIAVMFMVAYLYEHRDEADHKALNLTLRALLFADREVGF